MSIPCQKVPLVEGSPREPHTHAFAFQNGSMAYFDVDESGFVNASEEVLIQIFEMAGGVMIQ